MNEVQPLVETGKRRHYLPQFLLEEFKSDGLFELDKQADNVERRKVREGGQEIDLYPPHIEDGLFRRLDTAASRILQKKVYGCDKIKMEGKERHTLAEWLLFFAVRIPLNLQLCTLVSDAWNADPRNALRVLDEDIDILIANIKRESPGSYATSVQQLGGEDRFKHVFQSMLAAKVMAREHQETEGRQLFEQMHISGNHLKYVHHLLKLRWTWLRSNRDFVIGDNPLCRWHTKLARGGNGFNNRDLEITIPLSKRLTLWMHRNYNHAEAATCNAKRTKELNKRQTDTAVRLVYGPSIRVLRGGDYYGIG
jgi:hypothetical protein